MRSDYRLKHGLFWPTQHPPFPWRGLAVGTLCLLTYGLVARFDALEQRAAIMEQRAEINTPLRLSYLNVVMACANQAVNGGTAGFTLGDELFSVQCMKLSNEAMKGVKQ